MVKNVNGVLVLGEVAVLRKEEGSRVVRGEDAWGAFWEYAVLVAALHDAAPVHVEQSLALVNALHADVIKEHSFEPCPVALIDLLVIVDEEDLGPHLQQKRHCELCFPDAAWTLQHQSL